jgi:hypothetical protein
VQLGTEQDDNPFVGMRKFEMIIVSIDVLCFKAGMSTDQFFEHVLDHALLADKCGISLRMLPNLIDQMKRDIENLKQKKDGLRLDTESAVKRQGATMGLLREYLAEKPSFDSTKMQLENAVKERFMPKGTRFRKERI